MAASGGYVFGHLIIATQFELFGIFYYMTLIYLLKDTVLLVIYRVYRKTNYASIGL